MRLALISLLATIFAGGGVAFATVTMTAAEAGTGNSTINVVPGGSFSVDLFVAESGEGTGITGVQIGVNASGPSSGTISVVGPADSGNTSVAINAAEWDASLTGVALPMVTGPAPVGPLGSGYTAASVLSGAVTPSSKLATVQMHVDSGAASGAYQVSVSGLAFPDFVGANIDDITVTPGPALTVNVGTGPAPATIAGRYLYYPGSAWAGAVATDKAPLLPGSGTKANLLNICTYSKGIKGLYVDVANRAGAAPSAADFSFRTGTTLAGLAAWVPSPAPTVAVAAGAGTGGSDRVSIVFADNQVANPIWLEVTMKSDANGGTQGLAANDVFYWGSLIGKTVGGTGTALAVGSADYGATYSARLPTGQSKLITDPYDFDRNKFVLSADYSLCYAKRNNVLNLITVP